MSIFKIVANKIIRQLDFLVLKHLTVERGRNKRKWIWKTKNFKEVTQIYVPRVLYIGFVVYMCWKIHDKVKGLKKGEMYYEAKSRREEKVEAETKEIEHYLSIPNEFDPDRVKSPVSVEYKEKEKYEYHDLTDEELKKLDEFDDWIRDLKKS